MNKIKLISRGIAAFALGLTAMAAPVAAQQQQQQTPQVVTQFNDATITSLLRDVQATWRVEQDQSGNVNYRASAEGEINFTLAPRACSQETGCLGLMMLAVYTGLNAPSTAQLDAYLAELNDRSATVKVYRNGNIVILQGYMNSAYGISYRNAQTQLLIFGQDIVGISQALASFERGGN